MNSGYKISALDYLLIGAGTTLATLAAGFGLAIPGIGYTFATIIAMGTFISGFIRFNANHDKKWLDKDWIGFIAAAIIVIIFVVPLNKMLPEGGFPFKLIVASGLCWLLSFWSLFMWRDSSLLFPAVPAVALFSLVGSWDSFGGATFFFFGFMLCFATLFARSQMRLMVYRAELAGFTSIDQLIKGPWKWVAGPEWALASAVAMIGISLVFAPFFQKSVQSVAGFAKASGSVVKPSSAGPMPTFNNQSGSVARMAWRTPLIPSARYRTANASTTIPALR